MNTLRKGFALEWCYDCPTDSFGDHDLDRARYCRELFATEAEARVRAEQVRPLDVFGDPALYRFHTDTWFSDDGFRFDDIMLGDPVHLD